MPHLLWAALVHRAYSLAHYCTGDARNITPLLVWLQWRYWYSWYVNGTGNFVIAGGIGSVLA